MIGAAGTLCEFIDAIGYKPVELRLQCHQFQSVGLGCLIGNDEKPGDLSLIRFKLPVAKPPADNRGPRAPRRQVVLWHQASCRAAAHRSRRFLAL